MTVERLLFKLVDEVKNSHNTSYSLDKVADDVMKEFDELMQDRVLEEQAMRETEKDMIIPF